MALLEDIQLLQADYKKAKRCQDYMAKRCDLSEVGIASVKNALDAMEYVYNYNKRVDRLIDRMYETCENRFMIDRVRLLKVTKKQY